MKEIGWLLYLIVILSVCLGSANDYKTYYLEDPDLCSAVGLKQGKIKLDRNVHSAAILENKRLPYSCRIKVKTAFKTDGIIAVIQELVLQRNETSGECIDYVQFLSEDGIRSKKFCGLLNAEETMDPIVVEPYLQDLPLQDNTFLNKLGSYLIVDISISDDRSNRIKIAFTLYTMCQYNHEDFAQNFIPCRDGDFVCIRSTYFNDGIVNCPYFGCVDEEGCRIQPVHNEKLSLGSKVIISSMSSLVISFIVFVVCIYLCRKYKKLCWSENFSNPQPSSEMQMPRVMEMHEQPSQSEEQANVRNLEKDLPPSYESLFPDR